MSDEECHSLDGAYSANDCEDEIDSQNEEFDTNDEENEEDMDSQNEEFDTDDEENGFVKIDQDSKEPNYPFEVLNEEKIAEDMLEAINEVSHVTQIAPSRYFITSTNSITDRISKLLKTLEFSQKLSITLRE